MPDQLFLCAHGDDDRLQRVVSLIARDADDLVDDLDSTKDFTKYRIATIKTAIVVHADKKLRSIVVEVACAITLTRHFGHGQGATLMGIVTRLR